MVYNMPVWHYSVDADPQKTAKAMMWDVPVSYKKIVDLARLLRGKRVDEAERILNNIINLREAVPYRRYKGKQAHRRGLAAKYKWPIGRYPVKAAKYLLKLLENVKNNADAKGLSTENLRILHIGVHKGRTIKRWMPRAFGRSSPRFKHFTNIEIIVVEE